MRLIYHLYLPPCHKVFVCLMAPLNWLSLKNPVSFSSSTLEPAWRQALVKVLTTLNSQKHFWSFLCYVQHSSRDEPDWSRKRIKKKKRQAQRHEDTQKTWDLWTLSDWNHWERNLSAPELRICIGYNWTERQGRYRQLRGGLGYYIWTNKEPIIYTWTRRWV